MTLLLIKKDCTPKRAAIPLRKGPMKLLIKIAPHRLIYSSIDLEKKGYKFPFTVWFYTLLDVHKILVRIFHQTKSTLHYYHF